MKKSGIQDTPSIYAQAIEEYISRMNEVSLSECPAEFRVAYRHYLEAWQDLHDAVETLPDGILDGLLVGAINGFLFGERDFGLSRMAGSVKNASRAVKTEYRNVEAVAAGYDVALP